MRLYSEILLVCTLLVAVFARPENTETDVSKMKNEIVKGDVETDLFTRVKRQFYVPGYYPPVGAYYATSLRWRILSGSYASLFLWMSRV